MKNKLFTFLVIAAVLIAMTVLDNQDAFATEGGWAGRHFALAFAGCRLRCPQAGYFSFAAGLGWHAPVFRSAFCGVCPHNGWAYAGAYARPRCAGGRRLVSALGMRVPWNHWAWAKGEQLADTVVVQDTVEVSLDSIGVNQYELRTKGEMKLYPWRCAEKSWAHAEIRVYTKTDVDTADSGALWPSVDNTLFWGKIALATYGPFCKGDYDCAELSDSIVGDTLLVSFDVSDTITYDGDPDDLYIGMRTPDRATNVPTTTQWGIIILVALIVGSGVFIMLRRRKAAVPA